MNAGTLNRKIGIYIKSISFDSELNAVETWNLWREVWAKPIVKASREYYRFSNNNTDIEEIFVIRYIAGVNSHQRIKFNNIYYEIIGEPINPAERNKELIITCRAIV